MLSNFVIIALILVLLFLVYQGILSKVYGGDEYEAEAEAFYEENTAPAEAGIVGAAKGVNMPDNRVISPSGPNPPAASAPQNEVVVYADEQPHDPYAEKFKSPHVDDDIRYPERSFRPAPEMNDTRTAVGAGIASAAMGAQTYSPEMVMNGGGFMDGVVGLESDEGGEIGYSAF